MKRTKTQPSAPPKPRKATKTGGFWRAVRRLAAVIAVLAGTATSLAPLRALFGVAILAVQAVALIALPFLLQLKGYDTQGLPQFGWAAGWLIAYTASSAAARSVAGAPIRLSTWPSPGWPAWCATR